MHTSNTAVSRMPYKTEVNSMAYIDLQISFWIYFLLAEIQLGFYK